MSHNQYVLPYKWFMDLLICWEMIHTKMKYGEMTYCKTRNESLKMEYEELVIEQWIIDKWIIETRGIERRGNGKWEIVKPEKPTCLMINENDGLLKYELLNCGNMEYESLAYDMMRNESLMIELWNYRNVKTGNGLYISGKWIVEMWRNELLRNGHMEWKMIHVKWKWKMKT